ncbi:MAG: hypothetical protein ACI9G1_002338 [Pirellulaceae bacterium]|jgi:hypothetical protein
MGVPPVESSPKRIALIADLIVDLRKTAKMADHFPHICLSRHNTNGNTANQYSYRSIRSLPTHALSTSGTSIEPSCCW